jgi:hypothetical protein
VNDGWGIVGFTSYKQERIIGKEPLLRRFLTGFDGPHAPDVHLTAAKAGEH